MKVVKLDKYDVPVSDALYDAIYQEGYAEGSLSVREEMIKHNDAYTQGRADAIDEFVNKLIEKIEENFLSKFYKYVVIDDAQIEEIAEDLKEQKNE